MLTTDTLRAEIVHSIGRVAGGHSSGVLAQVLDSDEDTSLSAIFDVLAVGRGDPRVLVGLRYLLRALGERSRRAAIHVLSHATPHPDIIWHEGNWLPNHVKETLRPHFRWTPEDVGSILQAAPLGTFQRGQIGESAYMLLHEDPNIGNVARVTAGLAVRRGQYDLGETALYLVLYWLGQNAPQALRAFVREYPEAAQLPLLPEIQSTLLEHGFLALF